MVVRVGIVGATGYTGLELFRILENHPQVEVVWATSERFAGMSFAEYCPAWRNRCTLLLQKQELTEGIQGVDAVFLALPHGVAMEYVPALMEKTRVIDLGADFRLKEVSAYEKAYRLPHRAQGVLAEAVYGLSEVYRGEIRNARLVANPGCYPTSVLLPLYPLVRAGVNVTSLIVDSKSGVSGAGKKATEDIHFCEVDENFKAYKVGEHRHQPEMEEKLRVWGSEAELVFVPHLLPLKRGILSTMYLDLARDWEEKALWLLWEEAFSGEPWVRVLPPGHFPELKWVVGSNFIDIGLKRVGQGKVVIVSAIDNLTKGASGQAVQNLNIMFGIDERQGLPQGVFYP